MIYTETANKSTSIHTDKILPSSSQLKLFQLLFISNFYLNSFINYKIYWDWPEASYLHDFLRTFLKRLKLLWGDQHDDPWNEVDFISFLLAVKLPMKSKKVAHKSC